MNNIVMILGIIVTVATGLPVLLQLLKTHPRGLIVLFFAEMWERFSYYGMRGILVFYLTQHLLFDPATAASQYGSYTSLVYLVPLLGGVLADRWLGARKAVAFGALLLVAGHFTMAYEGKPATQQLVYAGQHYQVTLQGRMDGRTAHLMVAGAAHEFGPAEGGGLRIKDLAADAPLPAVLSAGSYKLETQQDPIGKNAFYLAVSLIIMGVGFLKPNISTIVGQLYPQGDPRRDSGFTLYYYGINLGAFWAAVLCGLLGQTVGWWAGFGLAGVGMAAGFTVFVLLGKRYFQGHGEPPNPQRLAAPFIGPISREHLIYLGGLMGIGVIWLLVPRNGLVGVALIAAIVVSLLAVLYIIVAICKTWAQRQRMMLAMVLIFGAVVFFTLFEQAGTSLNLFASTNVDLSVTHAAGSLVGIPYGTAAQLKAAGVAPGGFWIDTQIGAAQTQSFNAGFILLLAPVFAAAWAWLARRKLDPNPTMKFGLGLLQVGLGFMVIVWGAGMADSGFRLPLMLLGLLYLLHTTGELCLSPVGLSEITKLSLPSVVSFMMSVWFLAASIAALVGSKIAALTGTETIGGQVIDPHAALTASVGVFNTLGWAGIACGGVFVALSFLIRGWAHEEEPVVGDGMAPVEAEA